MYSTLHSLLHWWRQHSSFLSQQGSNRHRPQCWRIKAANWLHIIFGPPYFQRIPTVNNPIQLHTRRAICHLPKFNKRKISFGSDLCFIYGQSTAAGVWDQAQGEQGGAEKLDDLKIKRGSGDAADVEPSS